MNVGTRDSGGSLLSTADVDRGVAIRLRERRTSLGLSLGQLAQRIGCSRQQLFNYERAVNRIPATRLYLCAKELFVPMDFFFQRYGPEEARERRREHMTLEVILAFAQIRDPNHQSAFAKLVRQLARERA